MTVLFFKYVDAPLSPLLELEDFVQKASAHEYFGRISSSAVGIVITFFHTEDKNKPDVASWSYMRRS